MAWQMRVGLHARLGRRERAEAEAENAEAEVEEHRRRMGAR